MWMRRIPWPHLYAQLWSKAKQHRKWFASNKTTGWIPGIRQDVSIWSQGSSQGYVWQHPWRLEMPQSVLSEWWKKKQWENASRNESHLGPGRNLTAMQCITEGGLAREISVILSNVSCYVLYCIRNSSQLKFYCYFSHIQYETRQRSSMTLVVSLVQGHYSTQVAVKCTHTT